MLPFLIILRMPFPVDLSLEGVKLSVFLLDGLSDIDLQACCLSLGRRDVLVHIEDRGKLPVLQVSPLILLVGLIVQR